MRKPLVVFVATAALLGGALAGQASASCTTTCTATNLATFTLTSSGVFTITQVAASPLGTAVQTGSGVTVTGPLGLTTVTDGLGSGGWTVSASSTDFTGVTVSNVVPASAAGLTVNTPSTTGGTATIVPSAITSLSSTPATLLTATNVSGTVSVVTTYTPTISVAVPSTAALDTYTGTVTQTLS